MSRTRMRFGAGAFLVGVGVFLLLSYSTMADGEDSHLLVDCTYDWIAGRYDYAGVEGGQLHYMKPADGITTTTDYHILFNAGRWRAAGSLLHTATYWYYKNDPYGIEGPGGAWTPNGLGGYMTVEHVTGIPDPPAEPGGPEDGLWIWDFLEREWVWVPYALLQEPDDMCPDAGMAEYGEPVNAINGAMVHGSTDVVLPCPGPDIVFRRAYNSALTDDGPLGPGWTHSLLWRVAETSTVYRSGGLALTNGCLAITTGTGRRFMLPQLGTNRVWRSYRDVAWSVSGTTNGGYRLSWPGDVLATFDSHGRIQSIGDRWANTVEFNYSAPGPTGLLTRVAHANGQYIDLLYENDRIVAVGTPSPSFGMAFEYGASGELLGATRRTASHTNTTLYLCDPDSLVQTQRVNAAGDRFSYGYATESADGPPVCTGMNLNGAFYGHSATYSTNDSSCMVVFDHVGTNRVYEYLHDGKSKRITRIMGPNSSNLVMSIACDPLYLLATNVVVQDLGLGEKLALHRQYDDRHNVTNESLVYGDGESYAWQYEWDSDSRLLTSVSDPEQHSIEFDYTNGLLARQRVRLSSSNVIESSWAYTTNALLSCFTNANGHSVDFVYDANGFLAGIAPQAGPGLSFTHSPLGHLREVTAPGDDGPRITRFYSDELGRVTNILYPRGLGERFTYDALGNLTNHLDTADRSTCFAYAPAGKLLSVTRFLEEPTTGTAVTVSYDYDAQFNNLRVTDPLQRPVESYVLDSLDRIVRVTNLEGQVMSATYGVAGYISSLQRYDGTVVGFEYDAGGRLNRTRVAGSTNTYSYFGNGLLKTAGNRIGTVSNRYDAANRLIAQACVGSAGAVEYEYFPAGQVSGRTSVAGTTGYLIDEADRLTRISGPEGVFTYTYNTNNGLLSGMTCSDTGFGKTVLYDALDRPVRIEWSTSPGETNRSYGYEYDDGGMIVRVTRETGAEQRFDYDSLDRLITETSLDPAGHTTRYGSYEYDLAGNRTQKISDGMSLAYVLGTGNRLAEWQVVAGSTGLVVDVTGLSDEIIGTDSRFGERWVSNATVAVPSIDGTGFTAPNFPIAPGTQQVVAAVCDTAGNVGCATNTVFSTVVTNGHYGYDPAGCLTGICYRGRQHARALRLDWTVGYELDSVSVDGSSEERYLYDALGRRVAVSNDIGMAYHVYDGSHVVAEVNAAGELLRSYTYGPGVDNILAMTVHSGSYTETYYYVTDHLGSVHAVTAESGALVEQYDYDAWGRVLGVYDGQGTRLAQSAISNRYLWQGREYSWSIHTATDGAGLYYFRARWYDPVTGRWLSKDPIGINGGLNQYVFCGNNPANLRDPFGLCDTLEGYANSTPDNPWQNLNPFSKHFFPFKGVGAVLYGMREFGRGMKSTFAEAKADARADNNRVALCSIYAVEPWAYFSKGAAEVGIMAPVTGTVPGISSLVQLRAVYGVGQSGHSIGSSLVRGEVPTSDNVYGTIMPILLTGAGSDSSASVMSKVRSEMILNYSLSPGPGE